MIRTSGLVEVVLNVQDMETMVAFYRDVLGFKVIYPRNIKKYAREQTVTFNTGACVLALRAGRKPGQESGAPRIVFGVNDIEHARFHLLMRNVQVSEVRCLGAGVQVVDCTDPEGNPFSLEFQEEPVFSMLQSA